MTADSKRKTSGRKGRKHMAEFQYVIKNEAGLHARPAGQLVRLVKETDCAVTIEKDGRSVDAGRLMALMSLGVKKGDEITVVADDDEMLETLKHFFESQL